MTRTIDIVKNIYKPYRYTKKGKTTILETTSGKFLVKDKGSQDIKGLYNYLVSRSFDNFPNLIDGERDELNVFEYIEDTPTPKEQKALDLVTLVGNLHNKTAYFKEVTEDDYKKIYENIENNIVYLKDKFTNMFENITKEIYMSPSHYLLISNSSKLISALDFSKAELDKWYSLVKEKKKQRVSLIHNNLSIDHLIKGNKDYLVSWENAKTDSPVLDFVNLYKNEYMELDFDSLFKKYLEKFNLSDDEQKLLFIVLSLPEEITFDDNEFNNTIKVRRCLDYIYKTENLVRPYYSPQKPE